MGMNKVLTEETMKKLDKHNQEANMVIILKEIALNLADIADILRHIGLEQKDYFEKS